MKLQLSFKSFAFNESIIDKRYITNHNTIKSSIKDFNNYMKNGKNSLRLKI